jgi:hypothetical protein
VEFTVTDPRKVFCTGTCKGLFYSELASERRRAERAGSSCVQCGTVFDPSSSKAKCCSNACSVAWQNAKKKQTREASRGDRQPCIGCGGVVPDDRRWGSIYCSFECKRREHSRRARLRAPHYMREYLYGITRDQYEALLEAQDNACAICRTTEWNGKDNSPHVDHCHESGAVRGLLCNRCNNGLGRFRDDPSLLRAAANYLEAHSAS